MIENKVVTIANYATEYLQRTLTDCANDGYKLVSSVIGRGRYNVPVMYLFFVRETKEE